MGMGAENGKYSATSKRNRTKRIYISNISGTT